MHKHQPVLFTLIGINVLLFLIGQAGFELRPLLSLWLPQTPLHGFWQWLTHMFMHADLLHLLFNMYALGVFGAPLVRIWGAQRFLLLFFASGLAGAALYCGWLMLSLPAEARPFINMAGASGGAFGVLAAFAVMLPRAPLGIMFLPFSFPAKYFVIALVAYETFAQISGISLLGPNIAHLAHVGGALAGAALAFYWRKKYPLRLG